MADILKPGLSLLVKLGSIAVHAEELISPKREQVDVAAMETLLNDAEVKEWLSAMTVLAFMPVKR